VNEPEPFSPTRFHGMPQLLETLKALDGYKWPAMPAGALFGDAVLYKDCELQIVNRTQAPEPPLLAG
jgi:hypothetical protein